jgi:hypothetical protein
MLDLSRRRKLSEVRAMLEFLAVLGAIFLLLVALRAFPMIGRVFAGIGLLFVIFFVFLGLAIVFLPLLGLIALIVFLTKLVRDN